MAGSARDLLKGGVASGVISPLSLHVVLAICRWFPTIAMAVAFYRMQSAASGSFYPYGAMALA